MPDSLNITRIILTLLLLHSCVDSKTVVKNGTRPSDQTEDPPQFLDEDERDIIASEGGRASIGDASVDIAANALKQDARVRLRRVSREQLNDAAQAELAAGSEFFEVSIVDLSTGKILSDSELLQPVNFSRLLSTDADTQKVYFKFVTPVDSNAPFGGVVDNSAMSFEQERTGLVLSENAARYRASADINHTSFLITAIEKLTVIRKTGGTGTSTSSGSTSAGTSGEGTQSSSTGTDGESDGNVLQVIPRLSLNEEVSCASNAENKIKCWGLTTGVVGYWSGSSNPNLLTPSDVSLDQSFAISAIGDEHHCALDPQGSIWCWGNNQYFNPEGCCEPKKVRDYASDGSFVDIASGYSHSCAIKQNELLYCWGDNAQNQLGYNWSYSAVPIAVGSATWKDIAAGMAHTCGIQTNGSLWCWGENQWGTLGDGTTIDRAEPTRVGEATDWKMLGRGALAQHQCAIKASGSLWCWGLKFQGQTGRMDVDERIPQQVDTESDWAYVAMGSVYTCGIKSSGTLWCWSTYLGPGIIQIGSATDWTSVSIGDGTFCGTKTDDSVWCWGRNHQGQVGNGTQVDVANPAKIEGL